MYQNPAVINAYHQPQSHHSGPPIKKQRGNTIITKYPPPPGYVPPPQPQAPYPRQPPYAQPQAPYAQQPVWQQPQPYSYNQQPGYPAYQQQHPSVQPSYPYYQQPQLPQGYGATQPGWQTTPITAPHSAPPPQSWTPPQDGLHEGPRRHSSAITQPSTMLDGNGDPMPPLEFGPGSTEDLEEAYDAECYYARHPEEIEPTLSLGTIEWKAPRPARRALPSTFDEAELEAIAPRPPHPSDEESISEYFKKDRRHEALLSVRQTEDWNQDDPIFQQFLQTCTTIVPTSEMEKKYRARFDPEWKDWEDTSPAADISREPTPADDRRRPAHDGQYRGSDDGSGVLDDLERALQSDSHSRTGSVSSQQTERFTRPKALQPIRDSRQESILAALGVTGSPRAVFQTPGPALGPPPPSAKPTNSRANSFSSTTSGSRLSQPPTSAMPPPSSFGTSGGQQTNGFTPQKSTSAHSNYTAVGLDYNEDDATPRPKYQRTDSRKRSYADVEVSIKEEPDEDDGMTPKQRRKQPRVDDTYRRHW